MCVCTTHARTHMPTHPFMACLVRRLGALRRICTRCGPPVPSPRILHRLPRVYGDDVLLRLLHQVKRAVVGRDPVVVKSLYDMIERGSYIELKSAVQRLEPLDRPEEEDGH